MSGLLNQGQPQTEAPQQTENPGNEGQETPMDPEAQEQFDVMVSNGMKILYDEKAGRTLLNKITESDSPIEEIADITLVVIERLESAMESKNVTSPYEVKIQVANQLMGEIMDMCEQAGMQALSEEERYNCWSLAVSKYIDQAIKTGKMTAEQVQELSAQAQQTPEGQEIAAQMQGGGQGQQSVQQPIQQPVSQTPAQGGM